MSLPLLRLKSREDKRLLGGHLWIYSNEVDTQATPLKNFAPGALARVQNAAGKDIGLAFVSPQSLLCARLISRDSQTSIDKNFFVQSIRRALNLRNPHFPSPHYRLVHGEGDFLPGLIIDRYDDCLVLQSNTWGMEQSLPSILDALDELLSPRGVLLKNNGNSRSLEGLPPVLEIARGKIPERLTVQENGCQFHVDAMQGQKTGWFYDHRSNRAWLRDWVRGKRVLDLFSYVGGWGVQSAAFGASAVLCADASTQALGLVQDNARLNGVEARLQTLAGDAFELLKQLAADKRSFDVIILDPPAFIKARRDISEGTQAYRRLNQLALQLLAPGGLLASASCSYHLSRDMLLEQVARAASHTDKALQLLGEGRQDLDHPIHPSIPENAYLKSLFLRDAGKP